MDTIVPDPAPAARAVSFAYDPAEFFGYSYTHMHSLAPAELEELQLEALNDRLTSLRRSVAMVAKLADRQGIERFATLDAVVPMLFDHTMYKSYPPSLLADNRFDLLTNWLAKLTVHDLSGIDASGCRCLGEWVELLDRETPLKVNHSSGTSGVMSFHPFSKDEYRRWGRTWPICALQDYGDPPADAEDFVPNVHVLSGGYRFGATGIGRSTDMHAEFIAGSEDRVHTLYPGRMDSDVLYLAGRLRAAKARGTTDRLEINPALLQRMKEFQGQQAEMSGDMMRFFENSVSRLAGERVFVMSTWSPVYDIARAGLDRGLEAVFAPDSVVMVGGGAKGKEPPADWQEQVCRFFGVPRLKSGYGMSEVCGVHMLCSHDHYHVAPWIIPYVLDPATGQPLPRRGTTTGRAAFFDLLSDSHWGGFVTGDEITVDWAGDCPCGARSAYIENTIGRYSERQGGDDKITCAATPEAHAEAMEFLSNLKDAA